MGGWGVGGGGTEKDDQLLVFRCQNSDRSGGGGQRKMTSCWFSGVKTQTDPAAVAVPIPGRTLSDRCTHTR